MLVAFEFVARAAALPMLVMAALIFLLGCMALARERVTPTNAAFFVLTCCATVWLSATALQMMSTSVSAAEWLARVIYLGVCAIPAAVAQFTVALLGKMREGRPLLVSTWAVSAGFAAAFATSDLFITGAYEYAWGYYTRLGLPSLAFLLYFGTVLTASMLALVRAARTASSERQKKRIASFALALGVGYLASIDYLPSFGVAIYPVGCVAIFGFVALSMRAMRRFSFVDLTPAFVAEQLLESVHGGVIVVDIRGTVRVANPSAAAMLGCTEAEMMGKDLRSLLQMKKLPVSESQTFSKIGRTRNRPMLWRRHDGTAVEVSVSATLLRDREQLPVGILYTLHDLAERRRAERHEFAAHHDALTGLPNRTYLANRFEHLIAEIAASGRTAAALFLDLDGFKQINDQHGHSIGDEVLQLAATRLRNALRDDDVLARYGGDEFVALVSLRSADDAAAVADKLTRVLRSEPITIERLTLQLSASVGVAIAPRDGEELADLVAAADAVMYRTKRAAKAAHPAPRQSDRPSAPPFAIESRA